jgi:hypothetical protein
VAVAGGKAVVGGFSGDAQEYKSGRRTPMTNEEGIRWGWLRGMYILTIVIAGGIGLGMIFAPSTVQFTFYSVCDPVTYGIIGSVFLAFGILAVLGLRDPLKFVPILLLQLIYKTVWFTGVVLPLLVAGRFPPSGIPTVIIFALTIVGDMIAIPFRYVFAKRSDA